MVSLEQIKLLESKVSTTIDYVKKVNEENRQLKGMLDSYQKRIDELEGLIQQYKQDHSRIEDGILSALDRLNQFEDALDHTLHSQPKKNNPNEKKTAAPVSTPASLSAEENSSGTALHESSLRELDIF